MAVTELASCPSRKPLIDGESSALNLPTYQKENTMDGASPAFNSRNALIGTSAAAPLPPRPTPIMTAVGQIIEVTCGRPTVEQLSALYYAWGGRESPHTPGYATKFDACKSMFLDRVDSSKQTAATIRFNNMVRPGIQAQLPPLISMALEQTHQACQEKLEGKVHGYDYREMKIEMMNAIAALREPLTATENASVPQSGIEQLPATTAMSPDGDLPFVTSTAVTPASAPVAMFIPISPLSAPPHLAFLDTFPPEWRSRPAWTNVIASMDKYLSSFSEHQGAAQRALLQSHAGELGKAVGSIKLHTALAADEAGKVAYQREIVNIAMQKHFDKATNSAALGCETSRMMESEVAQIPGNQLSLSMRAPLKTTDGRVCFPVILSVSAPALDTSSQPEFKHYVKNQQFDSAAYRTSFEALAGHIKQCAAMPENKGAEVVLSGFGLANFLAALPKPDKEAAIAVGADVMTRLIRDLRNDGVKVAYTDYSGTAAPWPAVNVALGTDGIKCLGSIPGKWIKDEQIIVNAWDPHALVGNGCNMDQSLDGYIGRNSLVHETHALACILQANGFTH
jgi:hypothetical protein